jgi:hypothetical protein
MKVLNYFLPLVLVSSLCAQSDSTANVIPAVVKETLAQKAENQRLLLEETKQMVSDVLAQKDTRKIVPQLDLLQLASLYGFIPGQNMNKRKPLPDAVNSPFMQRVVQVKVEDKGVDEQTVLKELENEVRKVLHTLTAVSPGRWIGLGTEVVRVSDIIFSGLSSTGSPSYFTLGKATLVEANKDFLTISLELSAKGLEKVANPKTNPNSKEKQPVIGKLVYSLDVFNKPTQEKNSTIRKK